MSQILVVFGSAATAEYRVAGVPAAARAARAIAGIRRDDAFVRCAIVTGDDWEPSADLRAECERLAPDLPLTLADCGFDADPANTLFIKGEAFIAALALGGSEGRDAVLPALSDARGRDMAAVLPGTRRERACLADLRRAGCAILAATGKPGDGIVSRCFNRPISRTISRLLLRVPGLTPFHASMGTAILGLAMALSLVLGGKTGLIAGAILFQAASIFDGVDGEMARATHRTSDRGAMIDSLIDAATNLAFITGVTANIAIAGDLSGAGAGGAGLVMLATGLYLIGRRAEAIGQPVNFDVIKVHFRKSERRSPLMEWLILLTMRDFFAAAGAALILVGLTHWAMLTFATVAAGWLIVTTVVLARTAQRRVPAWARSARVLEGGVQADAHSARPQRRHLVAAGRERRA